MRAYTSRASHKLYVYTCAHNYCGGNQYIRATHTPTLGWQLYSTFFTQLSQVEEAQIEDDDQGEDIYKPLKT